MFRDFYLQGEAMPFGSKDLTLQVALCEVSVAWSHIHK